MVAELLNPTLRRGEAPDSEPPERVQRVPHLFVLTERNIRLCAVPVNPHTRSRTTGRDDRAGPLLRTYSRWHVDPKVRDRPNHARGSVRLLRTCATRSSNGPIQRIDGRRVDLHGRNHDGPTADLGASRLLAARPVSAAGSRDRWLDPGRGVRPPVACTERPRTRQQDPLAGEPDARVGAVSERSEPQHPCHAQRLRRRSRSRDLRRAWAVPDRHAQAWLLDLHPELVRPHRPPRGSLPVNGAQLRSIVREAGGAHLRPPGAVRSGRMSARMLGELTETDGSDCIKRPSRACRRGRPTDR